MPAEATYYLGIDQALTKSGFALYSPEQSRIFYGTVKTNARAELYDRIGQILSAVNAIRSTYGELQELFTEKPFLFKTTDAAIKLIRVETALHLYCYQERVAVQSIECNPVRQNSWPRLLGLESTKKDLMEKLQNIGVDLNDHESDAIGIVLGGFKLVTGKLVEYQSLAYDRLNLCQNSTPRVSAA